MSTIKDLTRRVSSIAGKQVLVAKTHSPTMLVAAGVVGMATSVVLACRATLKLEKVLDKGHEDLEKVEVASEVLDEPEVNKAGFGVKLQVAIDIAKLYAPSVILGVASIGAMAGSHLILKRRNAALAAAYTLVDKTFKDYRKRVVEDQGERKDLEYYYGVTEKEVVDPETGLVETIRGLDQEAVKEAAITGKDYSRIFDETHDEWSNVPNANQQWLQGRQNHCNEVLRIKKHIFLNDVYDILGMDRTQAGSEVGWLYEPEPGQGDGHVDFGVWSSGMFEGLEWINGHKDGILLRFNVDGPIKTKVLRKV